MKTKLGTEIGEDIRGVLYLCEYKYPVLKIVHEILFQFRSAALTAYANIPNPESQLAIGNDGTKESFEKELEILHKNMDDPKWCEELSDYL